MEFENRTDHAIYGTTLSIESFPVETKYGSFTAHVYQNLIHKGHIIALTYGDLNNGPLYTRIHSSCVTSETLGSMDCDCVDQLNGAIKKIVDEGRGVLFYLIQEGRGSGYVGKARACMHVQHTEDRLSTFDAYEQLGMKKDYRDYRNIFEIAHLLNIKHMPFVLMTNNPDKIESFQKVGLKVDKIESIEIAPGPFNQSYLHSKMESGHLLYTTKEKVGKYQLPHETIKPFEPHSLVSAQRFVYCASYFIPIRPINNCLLVSEKDLENCQFPPKIIQKVTNNKIYAQLHSKDIEQLGPSPHWFQIHLYYDMITSSDYIIMTYGDLSNKTPLVRIHSESIFNRFPLEDSSYKQKFENSVEKIVLNNSGIIGMFYHDGRGHGLSHFALSQSQSKKNIGISGDGRDYNGISLLLKEHLKNKNISVLYSESSKRPLNDALKKNEINVSEWIDLGDQDVGKGHKLLAERVSKAPQFLREVSQDKIDWKNFDAVTITGIGSSFAHAQYLGQLLQEFYPHLNTKILPLTALNQKEVQGEIFVISQGLSPNTTLILKNLDLSKVHLMTAVTESNQSVEKSDFIKKVKKANGKVYSFPLENEFTTLTRTIGPLCAYYLIYQSVFGPLSTEKADDLHFVLQNVEQKLPGHDFLTKLQVDRRLVIICSHPKSIHLNNVLKKLEEGAFLSHVQIVDVLEFAHGPFQNIEFQLNQGVNTCFALIANDNELFDSKVKDLLQNRYPVWEINSNLESHVQVLEYEMIFNHFLLKWITMNDINQVNWHGKEKQGLIYDLS